MIMDTFKGQDNGDLRELCTKNNWDNWVSEKYNTWMADEISEHLKKGIAPHDTKVSLLLPVIKSFHAKRIVD